MLMRSSLPVEFTLSYSLLFLFPSPANVVTNGLPAALRRFYGIRGGYFLTYCLLSRTLVLSFTFTCACAAYAACLSRDIRPCHTIDRPANAHSALRYRSEQLSCCRPVLLIDVRS